MPKAIIQQQFDKLKSQIDSLINENESLKQTADSLQRAKGNALDKASTSLQNADYVKILLLTLCISLIIALLFWVVWRFVAPSQYRKVGFLPFIRKKWWILPILLTVSLLVVEWLIISLWSCFLIAIVPIVAYGMIIFFRKKKKKSMLEKKDLEVNYEDDSEFSSMTNVEVSHLKVAGSPCIAAVASDTRKVKNQDSYSEVYIPSCNARIIAIADGVGSSYKSEVGSHFVTEKAVELIKKAIETDEYHIDFDKIFDDIQDALDVEIEKMCVDELSDLKPSSFGTTLIVGIDFPDRFVTAYVGNGSIWHVSGYFNKFPSVVCLPWNAVNLLNPDTTMVGGKEALYKIFFYKGNKKNHKPTVLQISKLRESPGDIFILTTDGVYSSDHAIASKDDEGDIWVPSTIQYGLLCELLKIYMEGNDDINDEMLKRKLETYLAHIKEAQIMDDDTTLGVFISAEARSHFLEERMKHETN
ncbi:protein phosphatase 2C domain-containing protein [Porphyromonas gingivalis]|uniref:protein phosphatase 2C domain-containing protein n=1 Tax=Porphyromonas gingivalis TaxID=837 RepID=UPI002657ABF3|nr:protein phosphatase 2C domain-containing protein [Porphyromonas gingivalis]MDP0530679.1 protein phosphatase 2C domain-containing protein [Porphyromonas gingivalis]MDP0625635.1 protein phosphatase 2C domain-containing protein [Porphyromonas gingivalis]WKD51742.1 protein phosphatase 2C domain-containing protein [Porphyromonas gingivalis]WKD53790.1 protein phosphatase 2C domain-containing protein [Porphyromonas gingivalis]